MHQATQELAPPPTLTYEVAHSILDEQQDAEDYDIGTRDLLPTPLLQLLPKLESTDYADPYAVLRLFDPATGSRWLVIAGSPDGDDYLLYCHVVLGDDVELGVFGYESYKALNDWNRVGGMRMPRLGRLEVDVVFEPARISELQDGRAYGW
jgi:hypothetical protein